MIRIKCPKCQQVLSLDDALAGTICSCDSCGQRFKAPQPKAVAAKVPVKKPAPAATTKPWQEGDDFTPYAVIQPEESDTRVKDDDRIDQMVKDSFRQKKRERAWEKVGTPAKLLKLFSLLGIGVFLLFFILCSIDCILYIFKLQQHLDNPGKHLEYPVPTMFLFDFFDSRPGEAPAELIWAIGFGITLVMFALYALTISGAENLRSLGSYTRAMIGSIVGIFVAGPAGILALFAVLDEDVKLQFAAYKKELNRREEKEWNAMQEQIQEELEEREEAESEGRPYRPRKRIQEQKKIERAQQSQALIVVGVGGLILLIALGVAAFFFSPVAYAMLLIGVLMSGAGFWQLMTAAFNEDAIQGLLVIFVGPYALYYGISRWRETNGALLYYIIGSLYISVGFIILLIASAAEIAKQ